MSHPSSPHPSLPYVYVRPIELLSKFPSLLCMYQHAKDHFWLPQDVGYETDAAEWQRDFSESERHLLSRILGFMTVAYCSMYDGVLEQFSKDVNVLEARYFFELQTVSQNIHTESIARALQRIIPDPRQRQEVLNSSIMLTSVSAQAKWARKWLMGETFSLSERLIALVFAKAIIFHSGYAIIEWFKRRGNLPGLSTLINLIANDALLHAEFACMIIKDHDELIDPVFLHNLVDEAVKIEATFIRNAFSFLSIPTLQASHAVRFVQFIADQTLRSLGYNNRFNASNTMPFTVAACLPILASSNGPIEEHDSSEDNDFLDAPDISVELNTSGSHPTQVTQTDTPVTNVDGVSTLNIPVGQRGNGATDHLTQATPPIGNSETERSEHTEQNTQIPPDPCVTNVTHSTQGTPPAEV